MVFTHNFSPHGATLWNNRAIVLNRKTLFIPSWYENNIIFITDIFDSHGQVLTFSDFKTTFSIQSSIRDFKNVCKALPVALLNFIQNYLHYSARQRTLPKIQLNQISLNDKKCKYNTINKTFKGKLFHNLD